MFEDGANAIRRCRRSLAASLVLAALGCVGSPPRSDHSGLRLPFWAGSGVGVGKAGVIDLFPHHACNGMVAIARVERMPELTGGALIPEEVIEFDSTEAVVARWAMPVDGFVVAIRGDEIVVPGPTGSMIFVSTAGEIDAFGIPDLVPPRTPRKCPDSLEIQDSAYLRCFIFEDLTTRARRNLAFEGPCT